MWLVTAFGFFSVVQKRGTKHLTVRARVRSDLDRLRAKYLPSLTATTTTPNTDYRYRATVGHEDLANAMGKIIADITYDNFKSEVDRAQGHPRETVYAKVWSVLSDGLPPLDIAPSAEAIPQAAKYGGVVFDHEGRVLLREPRDHYDGYVWTFAKGAPDGRETSQETALREVREETGIDASIVGVVPGVFVGGTGTCAYFVMEIVAEHPLGSEGRRETERIGWATEGEAKKLIAQTSNAVGRKRDLEVLSAAYAAWRGRR